MPGHYHKIRVVTLESTLYTLGNFINYQRSQNKFAALINMKTEFKHRQYVKNILLESYSNIQQ